MKTMFHHTPALRLEFALGPKYVWCLRRSPTDWYIQFTSCHPLRSSVASWPITARLHAPWRNSCFNIPQLWWGLFIRARNSTLPSLFSPCRYASSFNQTLNLHSSEPPSKPEVNPQGTACPPHSPTCNPTSWCSRDYTTHHSILPGRFDLLPWSWHQALSPLLVLVWLL